MFIFTSLAILLLATAGCDTDQATDLEGNTQPINSKNSAEDLGGVNAWPKASQKLNSSIRIEFDVSRVNDSSIKVLLKTNLPRGVKASVTIKGQDSTYYRRNDMTISHAVTEMKFDSVPTGMHKIHFLMPAAFAQPPEVKKLIGKRGEHLRGRYLRKVNDAFGVLVERIGFLEVSNGLVNRTYAPLPDADYQHTPAQYTDSEWKDWMSDRDLAAKKPHYLRVVGVLENSERITQSKSSSLDEAAYQDAIDESDERLLRGLAEQLGVKFDYLRAINAKGQLSHW